MKRLAALAFVIGSIAACRIGETNRETVVQELRTAPETRTCDSPFAKPDLSKLEACGDGKGHCYDSSKSPIADFPECKTAGSICIPDKLLTSAGKKFKACTFFIGNKPGACVSVTVKDIGANKDQLKQDVCDPDERCAPCIDPTNDQDTELCGEMGVHEAACVGGTGVAQQQCCHGSGVCLNREGVPEGDRGDLDQETCAGGQLCAPAALVDGKPRTCDVAGLSGVCLDICFATMLRSTTPVTRSSCGPTELCMPCLLAGSSTPGCG
jgi:hypothetical protein